MVAVKPTAAQETNPADRASRQSINLLLNQQLLKSPIRDSGRVVRFRTLTGQAAFPLYRGGGSFHPHAVFQQGFFRQYPVILPGAIHLKQPFVDQPVNGAGSISRRLRAGPR